MRQDQYEKLQGMSEKLADVFLGEADPDNWPGAKVPFEEHDKDIRGDRYWMKRNAVATISLIQRIISLGNMVNQKGGVLPRDGDEDLEREVKAAEKESAKLLKKLQSKSAKAKFDKKIHAKA